MALNDQENCFDAKESIQLPKHREIKNRPILVESINTGRQWRIKDEAELTSFMQGRNKNFYHIFDKRQ